MAEAILSKQHFYVNCQYYNDKDVDQDATKLPANLILKKHHMKVEF